MLKQAIRAATAAAYLGRASAANPLHTESDLRVDLRWWTDQNLNSLDAAGVDVEQYVRWLQDVRRHQPDPHLWASTLLDELQPLRFTRSYQSLTAAIRRLGVAPGVRRVMRLGIAMSLSLTTRRGAETQIDWVELPDRLVVDIVQVVAHVGRLQPREALLIAANAVTNDAGYAREALGVDAVHLLVRNCLSEHRDLVLGDAECMTAVRALLEVFVRVG